jgi:hypothetical protein
MGSICLPGRNNLVNRSHPTAVLTDEEFNSPQVQSELMSGRLQKIGADGNPEVVNFVKREKKVGKFQKVKPTEAPKSPDTQMVAWDVNKQELLTKESSEEAVLTNANSTKLDQGEHFVSNSDTKTKKPTRQKAKAKKPAAKNKKGTEVSDIVRRVKEKLEKNAAEAQKPLVDEPKDVVDEPEDDLFFVDQQQDKERAKKTE